jgi:hypothetical protein
LSVGAVAVQVAEERQATVREAVAVAVLIQSQHWLLHHQILMRMLSVLLLLV